MSICDLNQPCQIWGAIMKFNPHTHALTDSQNGWGGKRPLEVTWSKTLLGPHRAGCSAPCPAELFFLISLLTQSIFFLSLSNVLNQPKHLSKMCSDEDLTRLKKKCLKYFFFFKSSLYMEDIRKNLIDSKSNKKGTNMYANTQIHKTWEVGGMP